VPTTELNLTTVALADLRPDPANPRTHDARNLAAIAASLREHGQVEPLLVQRATMMVIGGNGRAEAMRSLGWKHARVALLDVSDVEARKLSIALNRTGELAGWDEAVLARHLSDLSELDGAFDVSNLGFSGAEMDALVAAYVVDVEQQAAPPAQPATTQGAAPAASAAPAEAGTGLPPGAAPAPMPASTVKVVQLFLSDATMEPFQMAVRKLAEQYGTDNITDTVYRAVLSEAGEWR
jgi:ParB-like chromosome segregation protein Spo0J